MHSARSKYTKQSASQLLTAVQVWRVCVGVVDWHLPLCYCFLHNTATVFTIATVAVTTARRTTTTDAMITVTSIGRSVGRSVEGLWKQKDRFQTAISNVLTPLLRVKGTTELGHIYNSGDSTVPSVGHSGLPCELLELLYTHSHTQLEVHPFQTYIGMTLMHVIIFKHSGLRAHIHFMALDLEHLTTWGSS